MSQYRVKFFIGADPQWIGVEAASPEEAIAVAQEQVGAPGELRGISVTNTVELVSQPTDEQAT